MLTRLLTKKVPYTFNRAGYYYFSRRVPADLLSHYSYPRIVQGLKTRSAQTAKSRALVAAAKLDEYWSHLRMADPDLIGRSLLKSGYGSVTRNTQLDVSTAIEQCITLPEALETYVTHKGAGKPKSFEAAAQRACTYLVDACGTKTLAEYQAAWKDFYAKPSHKMAREVITKGEATLDQQNTTGLSMLNANSVRHRILTAQDWLEKTPEKEAPQKATEKLYKRNADGSLVWVIK
jgi:hypothetical protein